MKQYYVYIVTNRWRGVLYTGVTNNLIRRIHEHRQKRVSGFTRKYNATRLVYFESSPDIRSAIAREKQIKGWLRRKKISMIEFTNPDWRDLSEGWFAAGDPSLRSG